MALISLLFSFYFVFFFKKEKEITKQPIYSFFFFHSVKLFFLGKTFELKNFLIINFCKGQN